MTLLVAVAVALTLASCGTRLSHTTSATTLPTSNADGLAPLTPTAAPSTQPATPDGLPDPGIVDPVITPSDLPSSPAPPVTQPTRTGPKPSSGGRGPVVTKATTGVTDKTITIGVRHLVGTKAFSAGIGEKGVGVQDTKPMQEAFIRYLNRHGGIAGRTILPKWGAHNIANLLGGAQESQQVCAAWSEDAHVFAAVSPIPAGSALPLCMASHHTPYIQDSVSLYFDDTVMQKTAGYFYTPNQPSGARIGKIWVESLARQGYFGRNPRIGLVMLDDPGFHRIADHVIKPALARLGFKVMQEATVGASADVAFGTLKFRSAGIDHVMILDDSSLVGQIWMGQASSQRYRPRYGLNSVNGPLLLSKNEPAGQLIGSVGVGWFPDFDVDFAQDPPANASTRRCRAIMRSIGVSLKDRASEGLAMNTCDTFWFLKAAIESSTEFSPAGLATAVAGLGTSYVPAGGFAAKFGPGRPDGAAAARDFEFVASCSCFKYTSQPYAID
jgi:hypothetical protein